MDLQLSCGCGHGLQLSHVKLNVKLMPPLPRQVFNRLFGSGSTWVLVSVAPRTSLVVVKGEIGVVGSWRSDDDDTR
jgi:hypothetical protein